MLYTRIFIFCAIFIFSAISSYGSQIEPIPVLPGKWYSKVTSTHNMLKEPIVKEDTQCVDKTEYNPEEMVPKQENCSLSNVKQKSNYLEYDMTCKGDGNIPPVSAHVVLNHKKKSYTMNMVGTTTVEGKEFKSTVDVEGKYLGPCDQ